ncbi:UNVERIFIED_ORG: hypothetical protein GGE64_005214 [Rhizobium etli]
MTTIVAGDIQALQLDYEAEGIRMVYCARLHFSLHVLFSFWL